MASSELLSRRDALRLALGGALLLAAGPAAAQKPPAGSASARLARIGERYYRGFCELYPMAVTETLGDPAFNAAFSIDIAPAHLRRQRRFFQGTARVLRALDRARLTEAEQLGLDLLLAECRTQLALLDFPGHLLPVGHMGSMPVRLAEWASGQGPQPLRTAAEYRQFLARLRGLPGWIRQAIANMDQGLARGITLPRPLVERTLPQIDALLPADPAASPYLAGLARMPAGVSERERAALEKAYRRVVEGSLTPALQRLRTYLRERYLPRATTAAGLGALPRGDEWYRELVAMYTTTDLTPAEIHETGLREVARIRAELERVKAQFRYEGPLTVFLQTLEQRPELAPFKTEEEVLQAYGALNDRIVAALPALFERAPKVPLQIRAVDAMSRDTASDTYVPPSLDGTRPGTFMAAIPDPTKYRTPRMTALLLHEGQPGHHYQISLERELSLPRFRRLIWYTAFGEGWALYAESLGRELGLYEDANAWLGRLLMELHRSLRLVVDTGLHARGWTREQAIAYVREQEGMGEEGARRAVERYMAWPGQALAYKIGELKIQELRDRARQKLGPRFDIRRFHTVVLEAGTLPLSLLQARVEAWIARQA